MKLTLVLPALAAVALAQPHDHRRRAHGKNVAHHQHLERDAPAECVIETEWVTETAYVDQTTTITYSTEPTEEATTEAAADPEPTDAEFYEEPTTEAAAPPPAETPTPAPEPVVEKPKTSPKPKISTSAAAPAPVVPVPSQSPVEEQPAKGGSTSDSYTYSGSMSYYDLGLGACGEDDSGKDMSDFIVAVAADTMGTQSNGNPICGKTVNIKAGSKTAVATVRDKCPGCSGGAIDASKALFIELFGGLDQGRGNVEWSFSD